MEEFGRVGGRQWIVAPITAALEVLHNDKCEIPLGRRLGSLRRLQFTCSGGGKKLVTETEQWWLFRYRISAR